MDWVVVAYRGFSVELLQRCRSVRGQGCEFKRYVKSEGTSRTRTRDSGGRDVGCLFVEYSLVKVSISPIRPKRRDLLIGSLRNALWRVRLVDKRRVIWIVGILIFIIGLDIYWHQYYE